MLRPDVRLLAMSATLDGARLSAIMHAPIVESAGRMHPVEIRHAARDLKAPRDLPEAMARAVRATLADAAGDGTRQSRRGGAAFGPRRARSARHCRAALDGSRATRLARLRPPGN